MKRLIAALLMLAGSANAQNMTPEMCSGSVAPLTRFAGLPSVSSTVAADGRCTALDVVLYQDETQTLRADRVYWRLEGADRWIEDGLPPTRIEISAEGIWPEFKTGDVVLDYLLRVQNKRSGISAELVVEWDEDEDDLLLEAAFLDFGPLGYIDASAKVTGVDLGSRFALRASALIGKLTELDIKVQSTGLFENYALLPLGTLVLRGEADPARAAAIIKAHRIDDIRALESRALSEESKDALVELVEELPNPDGILEISLRSEDGLGARSLGPAFLTGKLATFSDAINALSDSDIAINWTSLSKP